MSDWKLGFGFGFGIGEGDGDGDVIDHITVPLIIFWHPTMARDIPRHYSVLFSGKIGSGEERGERKKKVFPNRKHVYGPHHRLLAPSRYAGTCLHSLLSSRTRRVEEFSFAAVPAAVAHLPYIPTCLPTYIRYIRYIYVCIYHAVLQHNVLPNAATSALVLEPLISHRLSSRQSLSRDAVPRAWIRRLPAAGWWRGRWRSRIGNLGLHTACKGASWCEITTMLGS
jgi:hypothetical protein